MFTRDEYINLLTKQISFAPLTEEVKVATLSVINKLPIKGLRLLWEDRLLNDNLKEGHTLIECADKPWGYSYRW